MEEMIGMNFFKKEIRRQFEQEPRKPLAAYFATQEVSYWIAQGFCSEAYREPLEAYIKTLEKE